MKKILALIVIGVIGYFSYGHYMNNNVDSTDKLTFTDAKVLHVKQVVVGMEVSTVLISRLLGVTKLVVHAELENHPVENWWCWSIKGILPKCKRAIKCGSDSYYDGYYN